MVRFEKGNLWKKHDMGACICIPTNRIVKSDGLTVMGAGLALTCRIKFPETPRILAGLIWAGKDIMGEINDGIYAFPTKTDWRDSADILLIWQGLCELKHFADCTDDEIFLPRIGCGLGGLDWDIIKQYIISAHLPDNVIFLE